LTYDDIDVIISLLTIWVHFTIYVNKILFPFEGLNQGSKKALLNHSNGKGIEQAHGELAEPLPKCSFKFLFAEP
jgi:hypothetical protein